MCRLKSVKYGIALFCYAGIAEAAISPFFTISHAPPQGFLAIATPQKMLVDVKYAGQYIGTYPAIVSPTTIRFLNPAVFLNKIPRLKNSQLLATALAKTRSTNSAVICQGNSHIGTCGVLQPKMIGVIYNPNTFAAELFINAHYLTMPHNNRFRLLPNSSSGWSYSNTVDSVYSGNNNQNNLFNANNLPENSTVNNNYWSLTTDSVLGYKNNHANLSLSYNNPLANGNQLLLNQADVERDQGMHSYSAGLIQTNGSQFFPNLAILGGQYATTLKTVINELNASSTPLVIFINLPSQVSIFKNGQLIYSKFLPGGYQKINTNNFPEGAYQLTVKTVDSQGNTNTRQYYYSKTNQLPPLQLPQYSIAVGDEVATPQFDTSNSTDLLNIPVYQMNYTRRLTETMGVDVGSVGNDKRTYLTLSPIWVYGPLQFGAGLLGGTQDTLGANANLGYTLNKFGAQINYLQLFSNNRHIQINNNAVNYYDRLLTVNNAQMDASIDYTINRTTTVNLLGSYNAMPASSSNYNYGVSVNKTLFEFNTHQLNLNLSANRSNTDYTVTANLVLNFNAPNVNASLQSGYLYQHNVSPVTANVNNEGSQSAGSINWSDSNRDQYGYNVGLQGSTSPSSSNVGTTYENTNRYAMISAYGNDNSTKGYGETTQYGGELTSRFNWASNKATISNGQSAGRSGVIVYVASKDPNAHFLVHTAMRPGFEVTANTAYFIPLTAYQQYEFQMSNNSSKLYYLKNKDKLVTLYPGNIQALYWDALTQHILIGRLLTPAKKPIGNAAITSEKGNFYTDSRGYFQLTTFSDHLDAHVNYGNNQQCELKLPGTNQTNHQNNYTFLGDVVCVPVS